MEEWPIGVILHSIKELGNKWVTFYIRSILGLCSLFYSSSTNFVATNFACVLSNFAIFVFDKKACRL